MIVKQALYRLHALHIHRSRYKCHNRALCNSVDVPTTRVEFPSLWLFPPSAALSLPLYFADCAKIYSTMHTIRGFNPLRAHVTATIKDRFEMTQRYPFTLIRDTPVTINYSESVRIHPGLFFFIWKNLSLWNFQRFKLFKLSEIQVLSLSVFTISKCIPSRIEISNFSDFLASNFWKKASICTFSKLSIFPFFFFSISSFSKINFSNF